MISLPHSVPRLESDAAEQPSLSLPTAGFSPSVPDVACFAAHVVHLFRRPEKIQAQQFVQAVDHLISFAIDPEHFFTTFKSLVIRHVKYGVKAEYTKAWGKSVLLGIEQLFVISLFGHDAASIEDNPIHPTAVQFPQQHRLINGFIKERQVPAFNRQR